MFIAPDAKTLLV